ncbi:protein S100-A1 [Periophthalmus magnuspinnatus]|uniref:protein S100-A1 n=1 Tax=Periophthalmus magnuspinnatus TaxID=409849 RepID=UPI00145ADFC8|nr:protein S100-A1 [Periophthalmus magnuspinnatus]
MTDSRVTMAIQTLMQVFHEYASKDEAHSETRDMNQFKLSKRELKELLQKELNFENVKDSDKVDELMKELDSNGDSQVDFQEFVIFVVSVACMCNDFLETLMKEDGE